MSNKTYTVNVKFKKNRDFSNNSKMKIINALSGIYKVDFESLNDMNNKQTRSFEFPKKEVADNFAKKLFASSNELFDIETSEPIIKK